MVVQVNPIGYAEDTIRRKMSNTLGLAYPRGSCIGVLCASGSSIPGVESIADDAAYAGLQFSGWFGILEEDITATTLEAMVTLVGETKALVYRYTVNMLQNNPLIPSMGDGDDEVLIGPKKGTASTDDRKVVAILKDSANASSPGDNDSALKRVIFNGISGFGTATDIAT